MKIFDKTMKSCWKVSLFNTKNSKWENIDTRTEYLQIEVIIYFTCIPSMSSVLKQLTCKQRMSSIKGVLETFIVIFTETKFPIFCYYFNRIVGLQVII